MPNTPTEILIVDDQQPVRTSLAHVLTELGYRVREAEDGFSALSEIRQQAPDILVSDLNMPGMSGFELLSVVRRRFPQIQTIAMSGAFCGNEVPSGIAADAFYQKGSSIGALLQIMGTLSHLERRAARPPNHAGPIRIQRNEADATGELFVTVNCPECLRSFPQVACSLDCNIHQMICVYCGSSFQFGIAESMEELPLQNPRKRPAEARPMPWNAARFNY
jgi:CheY-like chemotaxis protein